MTKNRILAMSIAAAMAGARVPAAILEKLAQMGENTGPAKPMPSQRVINAPQASKRRVAMDMRAARKKRNRIKARRKYHG